MCVQGTFEKARKAASAKGWVYLDVVNAKGCGPTRVEVRKFTKCECAAAGAVVAVPAKSTLMGFC